MISPAEMRSDTHRVALNILYSLFLFCYVVVERIFVQANNSGNYRMTHWVKMVYNYRKDKGYL